MDAMNVAVILKQVPDTEAVIKVDPINPAAIVEEDIKFVLNPYDEFAVEEALTIAEETGGEAVGVCIGPERSETALRTALAMGLSRAILIPDPEAVMADVVTQGKILAAALRDSDVSLILAGREVIDTQEDALAPSVAEALGYPHVLNAAKIELDQDHVTVLRDIEGGSLRIEAELPAVISCQKGLNDPRYPTLIAIKRSKMKEIKQVNLAELGIDASAKSTVVALRMPPPRPPGVLVKGEPQEVVAQCLKWLAEEAKLI
jgi:electron transfer flavoprotein beta subunit